MPYDPEPKSARQHQGAGDLERSMRRTLGGGASSAGQRRRFAQDGDVPVVVVRGRRDDNRDASEAAARSECVAREQAERNLAAAQTTIRDLQTKLAHMDMSQTELRQSLDRVSGEKRSLQLQLDTETSARSDAEERLEKEIGHRQMLHRERRVESKAAASTLRSAELKSSASSRREQRPVDWWSKHDRK